MAAPPDPRSPGEPLSSTLRQVVAAQQPDGDAVSWSNLHDKVVQCVADAVGEQRLPPDKGLDDLTQEVLLQVFRDLGEFRVEPGASFGGWVRTIAERKLKDCWRRARAKKRGGGRVRHLGDLDASGGRERIADPRGERPSMLVRLGELHGALQQALDQLSDKHRRVIELRLFQGRSFAEIMPLLGYTKEVTVRSLHLRALQRLQELLAGFTG